MENLNLPYNEELLKSIEADSKIENEKVDPEFLQQTEKVTQDFLKYLLKRSKETEKKLNYLKENNNYLYLEILENHNKQVEKNKQQQKK